MSLIRIPRFGGLNREVTDRHVSDAQADVARNTELRDGSLRPYREPLKVKDDTDAKTVYETIATPDCCAKFLCFDECVSITQPMDPRCTGDTRIVVWPENCETDPYWLDCETEARTPLIVPAPTTPTAARRTAAGVLQDRDHQSPDERAYTYTFVDSFGNESPPATPTAAAMSYDDETWEILGQPVPPANVVCVRVYRTTSAPDGNIVNGSTDWQMVTEIPRDEWNGMFTDDYALRDMDMGALDTMFDCPPPCLCDVHELDAGYHVGFRDNELWFSERHQPHNWPERYKHSLPFKIRGLAVNNDVIYVGTSGNPYVVRVGTRADELTGDVVLVAEPAKYDQPYPMVGRRTIAATAWGAAYVGREGIVALQPSLPARVITRQRIDEDLWLQHIPNRIAWVNGRLYGSQAHNGRGFVIDVRGEPEGPRDYGDFVEIDLAATDMTVTHTGQLLFSNKDGVFLWDNQASHDLMEYTWKSKRFVLPGISAMRAAKVVGSFGTAVKFEVFADDRLVYSRDVDHSRPFRLPKFGRALEYQVQVTGMTTIHEVNLATSIGELSTTGSGGNRE